MRKVPLNLFGMAFGLAGLGGSWLTAATQGYAPAAIGLGLLGLAAVVWAVVLVVYARSAIARRTLAQDMVDPILGPFAALILIAPMLVAAPVLPHPANTIAVDAFATLILLHGSWFTGQLIYSRVDFDQLHPGYFLPSAAGGLVAAACAAQVGQHEFGVVMLGFGLVSWLILGSLILGRLVFRPQLPDPLVPTIAIEVAPAAVASNAYFALFGERVDVPAALLGGYGLLMVLAQLRILPRYLKLRFGAGFWAFAFAWASVATAVLHWLNWEHPAGQAVWAYLVLAAITALVAGIAVRTVVAVVRDTLLPLPVVVPAT
ncbi:C4-dicarboxylate transporter [Kutzneria sp. 744]|uniref:SLAC1 family transporter n=1 Tax=Kutzneria sp. (strain 744) TaxID=345341 RepID=UPI0003EEDE2A|nr:C4-dicarboxylate transporter [Kutzneria sp. 744]EWM18184.1 TehA protein [Kutzneria sp. 744]